VLVHRHGGPPSSRPALGRTPPLLGGGGTVGLGSGTRWCEAGVLGTVLDGRPRRRHEAGGGVVVPDRSARRKEVGDGENKMNRYLCNYWQMDKYLTQKQLKARAGGAFTL